MILFAAAVVASFLSACVPVEWPSADPASLSLLNDSSVNCLLIQKSQWNAALVEQGHKRGLKLLAVIDVGATSTPAGADAVVIAAPNRNIAWSGKVPAVFLTSRNELGDSGGVVAISQAVWPEIRTGDDTISTPSSAPWINTNLGYLRYLRSHVQGTIWITSPSPKKAEISARALQQAVADAALAGARWIATPDPQTIAGAMRGDGVSLSAWQNVRRLVEFIHNLPDVSKLKTYSRLGINVSPSTGALVSGGVLDMVGAQHIPFQVTNSSVGFDKFFDFADNALVKFPATSIGRTAIRAEDVDDLEPIYRRVEVDVGRTNYGLRVFNGAGLLSAPYALPDNKGALVLMTNYTDAPAENITLHVLGHWTKATLDQSGQQSRSLVTYPVKTATAVEIDSLDIFGAIRVE
ncbi:MAG TPA: hypothetical protein VH302_14145 [Bryobacteraceae bacterium]|nr:hypothetical protein [Bryobacteraceae bacterium]